MRQLVRGSDRPGVATTQTRVRAAVPRPQPRSADREGDRRRSSGGLCGPSSLAPRDINIVLLTTQIKHWLLTPPSDRTFKLEVTFWVRGVATPPCGVPRVTFFPPLIRRCPLASVSSTAAFSHILIRRSIFPSLTRRATHVISSECGIVSKYFDTSASTISVCPSSIA